MSNHQFTRPEGTGESILGSDDKTMIKSVREGALGDLTDKLNELAKCLFTLNNRRYGPIPELIWLCAQIPVKSSVSPIQCRSS